MKQIILDKGWTCRCLTRPGEAVPVTVPHDAMLSEPRTADSMGEGNIGWYVGGDYEYVRETFIPEEYRGRVLVLELEGVYHHAEVWLNGEKLCYRPYGYTNFYVELTEKLRYGETNELRVIARNSDQPNSRWYTGTGIYRPVVLHVGDRKHIPVNGLRVRTVGIEPPELEAEVQTSEEGTVRVELLDGENVLAAATCETEGCRATLRMVVSGAQLWDTEHPKLYTCRAGFEGDTLETGFGFRTLKWDAEHGISLNGRHVLLRGACIHHDNGLLGACSFPEAEERRVRILKANGYNALRSAHNPCSKALLEACDRQGMLMMDEYVDVWYMHKTAYDYATQLADWWKQDLKDMVDKDYNHPCVILYSTGNEVAESAQKRGIELCGQFTQYLHELDGTRPVTCGINIFFNLLSTIGFGVYSDEKAQKGAESAAVSAEQKKKKKPVGSEFFNVLACLLGDFTMKLGAWLPPCDLVTRDAFAAMDIAGYNYGLFRYRKDLRKYPNRLILGSETFCKDAYRFYEFAKRHERIVGDFVWAGMDYIGETGLGSAEYPDYHIADPECAMTGNNGRVDLLGKRRAEAAYTLVAFEQERGPFIAVDPPYQTQKLRLTGWQLSKAIESWAWRGSDGRPVRVEVYARAARVDLLVNGERVGSKRLRNGCRAVFDTVYHDGEVTAVSYDRSGAELGRYTLRTAGTDARLCLEPEERHVRPEGIAFVDLRYRDGEGIWAPTEKHRLRVTVENGELLGLGSANSYVRGNYTDDETDTYYGEAMAVIRAGESGTVMVRATDENGSVAVRIPIRRARA